MVISRNQVDIVLCMLQKSTDVMNFKSHILIAYACYTSTCVTFQKKVYVDYSIRSIMYVTFE